MHLDVLCVGSFVEGLLRVGEQALCSADLSLSLGEQLINAGEVLRLDRLLSPLMSLNQHVHEREIDSVITLCLLAVASTRLITRDQLSDHVGEEPEVAKLHKEQAHGLA